MDSYHELYDKIQIASVRILCSGFVVIQRPNLTRFVPGHSFAPAFRAVLPRTELLP